MESVWIYGGILYMLLGVVLPPAYIRIVYIFISRKKYRALECYRVMAQIGIVQLLAAPGAFCVGLLQLSGHDPWGAITFFALLFSTSIVVDILLNFLLALERLSVMSGITAPVTVRVILMVAIWLYGIVFCVACLTPLCGYRIDPGDFISQFDYSRPYTHVLTQITSVVLILSISLTFIAYVAITVILVQRPLGFVPHLKRERAILMFAAVRFLINIVLTVVIFFVPLPHVWWIGIANGLAYILNQLLVAPVLYLVGSRRTLGIYDKNFLIQTGRRLQSRPLRKGQGTLDECDRAILLHCGSIAEGDDRQVDVHLLQRKFNDFEKKPFLNQSYPVTQSCQVVNLCIPSFNLSNLE
uniref:G protein-coupled receptor n=1 Tax=Steinernema glaseri TaxID=37863 RepID=A0A1I7YNT7_9BILA